MSKLKKSCWNCSKSKDYRTKEIPQTYWEPGEPAMVEDCDAPLENNTWDMWADEFNQGEKKGEYEEYFASKCPHYTPEIHPCPICKKKVAADQSYLVHGIYDEEYYTCSESCERIQKNKIALEYDEEYRQHFK
jgi:YHS domain-containing protein